MVFARFWFASAALAAIMTILFVVFARRQVTLTSGIAGFAWFYCALNARQITMLSSDHSTTTNADLVGLQLLTGGLAFVSFVVLYLYQTGDYPPQPPMTGDRT